MTETVPTLLFCFMLGKHGVDDMKISAGLLWGWPYQSLVHGATGISEGCSGNIKSPRASESS